MPHQGRCSAAVASQAAKSLITAQWADRSTDASPSNQVKALAARFLPICAALLTDLGREEAHL